MQKRSSKAKRDINQTAHSVVKQSILGNIDTTQSAKPEKNPAAVALGRLGGLKGGKARAAKLSKSQRAEIAARAASVRWGKK